MADTRDHMTDEELVRSVATMNRDNPQRVDVELRLQARNGARLVSATQNLVLATKWLGWATWALVLLTAVVAGAAVLEMLGGH